MSIETIIATYGYPALFAGTLLEGETIVIIAGLMAHAGYLDLPWVMVTAFAGAFIADQTFFQIGKRKGKPFLEKRPQWEPRIDRIRRFLVGYQVIAVLGYRFIYGMRTITPIVIGASDFPTLRFVALNLCSTLLWSALISTAGYFFGQLFQAILSDFHRYEMIGLLVIIGIVVMIWVFRHRFRKDRQDRQHGT